MPSDKPRLATYTNNKTIRKFQYIADIEKRSASKELEFIVDEYISTYEAKHGELIVGEDGTVSVAKPKSVNGQSSTSKTG